MTDARIEAGVLLDVVASADRPGLSVREALHCPGCGLAFVAEVACVQRAEPFARTTCPECGFRDAAAWFPPVAGVVGGDLVWRSLRDGWPVVGVW